MPSERLPIERPTAVLVHSNGICETIILASGTRVHLHDDEEEVTIRHWDGRIEHFSEATYTDEQAGVMELVDLVSDSPDEIRDMTPGEELDWAITRKRGVCAHAIRNLVCNEPAIACCQHCDTPFCGDHGTKGGDTEGDEDGPGHAVPAQCWQHGGHNVDG